MFIKQIYTACLAQASYYIESNGEAAVIDPIREPGPYLELAASRNSQIKYVFETHFHADFVSGHIDLSKLTGAPIIFGPGAETGYQINNAEDGQSFALGDLTLQLKHTPGHTLESSCYLLYNAEGKEHAIFTGDTLFVGDVGRPDLLDGIATKEELASHMYRSLNKVIKTLPDDVIVYPAHGPGSSCGKTIGPQTWSTIGDQKKGNYALQEMSESEFVKTVTSDLKAPPPYFFTDASINKNGYEEVAEVLKRTVIPLPPDTFRAHIESGAVVLDTRKAEDFEKGFVQGAINIGLDGMYAIWAGTLINHETPLLIIADDGREEEAISRLARVGYEQVLGYLEGGFQAWKDQGLISDTVSSISAVELTKRTSIGRILDVRKEEEYKDVHLDHALNIPLASLEEQLGRVDDKDSFFIHCATGYRSMTAASLLKRNGISNFINISGGMESISKTSIKLNQ